MRDLEDLATSHKSDRCWPLWMQYGGEWGATAPRVLCGRAQVVRSSVASIRVTASTSFNGKEVRPQKGAWI